MDPLYLAAIDAGSNAIRFAAAALHDDDRLEPLAAERIALRLGTDAFSGGALEPETMDAAVAALRTIRRKMDGMGIIHYRGVATSALRESANGPELVERAWREAGVRLEVISGEEEARLGWRAARARVDMGDGAWILADLGGGSLEVTLAGAAGVEWTLTRPYGSVRLLREMAAEASDPEALRARLAPLEEEIRTAVAGAGEVRGLLASGGSVDALADIVGAAADDGGGRVLTVPDLADVIGRLAGMAVADRVELLGLTPDRADVILLGAVTYEVVAKAVGAERILIPGSGVREGLLLDLGEAVRARKAAANPSRVVFLSDVHANALALRSALEEAERLGAGAVIAAGDLVGDGPHPCEVVRMVRGAGIPTIRGNVDRKILRLAGKKRKKLLKRLEKGPRSKLNRIWTALRLRNGEEEEQEWLEALPTERSVEVDGVDVLVVHGSPLADDDRIFSSLTPEALATKLGDREGERPDVLVCGHTHAPFTAEVDGVLVVNCGSAGRPADGDPRGSLIVADLVAGAPRAEVVRFEYPVDALVADLAEADVPGVDPAEYREGVKS